MKELFIECNMGAAGDMLMGALMELVPDRQAFVDKMNSLGLPGVEIAAESTVKCGVTGTHMKVTVHGEEEHSHDDHDHEHEHHHHDDEHEHHHHHDEHEHHHHHDDEHEHHHHHDDEHEHHHHHDDEHEHHHHHDDEHEHHHHHDDEHEHHHHHDDEHEHHHHHDDEHEHHHDHEHEHHHDHEHEHHHHHHHAAMHDIREIINGLDVSDKVKADALSVYKLIAAAESQVHGRTVDEIHFHEVGTLDAVTDVVGVCLLMEMIGADGISASPVHVGSGHVHCAHGILPVPAPATALILNGIPTYGGKVRGELCTPTGAALLKHFCKSFGDRPVMAVEAIGYGMGNKDFEQANCVRAFLGEAAAPVEDMIRLECNLDDMTGEDFGFVMDILFENGARDVYTQAIGMKKSRPGIMLNVLCKPDRVEKLVELMFRHTTTLGIRRFSCSRYYMERETVTRDTKYGPVRVKISDGCGAHREKAEYEDLARIARETGKSLAEIRSEI